jgi:hypothetical protein
MAEIQRALDLGAREYVEKPSNLAAFNAVVRKMIGKWVMGEDQASSNASAGT